MQFTAEQLRRAYHRKVLNQELSLKEFAEKKVVLESRPSKLVIELTQNCNYRCVMCLQSKFPKYAKFDPALNMPMEVFDRIAGQLLDDAYFVDLRGFGETVILPYWPEVVDRLETYPLISWHLVTNLSLPRDATWDKMIKCGFVLGFSCDAATKETFEAIRVRSHFERILHNLGVVSDSIKRHQRGHIYFITTVQKRNVHELPGIIELAHRFSVREVQFKMVQGEYHDEGITKSDAGKLHEAISRSIDLALEYRIRLTLNDTSFLPGTEKEKARRAASMSYPEAISNWPPPADLDPEFTREHPWVALDGQVRETWKVSQNKRCFKPFHFTYIASDGRVGTCNHMMNPAMMTMGSLRDSPFDEIWNGELYQFFRAQLLYNKLTDPRCRWCFAHRLED